MNFVRRNTRKRSSFSEFEEAIRRNEARTLSMSVKQTTLNKTFKASIRQPTLYGSDFGGQVETSRAKYVLLPDGTVKVVWDAVLLLLIFLQLIYLPLFLCFDIQVTGEYTYFEFCVTVYLFLTILLNFNTGFYQKGSLVTKRSEVALHYLRGAFCLDVVIMLPYNWVVEGGPLADEPDIGNDDGLTVNNFMRTNRLLKMVRMLQLLKIHKIVSGLEHALSSERIAIFVILMKLIGTIILIGHWIACFWFLISEVQASTIDRTWTQSMRMVNNGAMDKFDLYVAALYWAFTTMITVGFGDIIPLSTMERLYATFVMLAACCVFAYLLGSIGSLVQKQSAVEDEYTERIVQMNTYMKKRGIPYELQARIRSYLHHTLETLKQKHFDEQSALEMLSGPLRMEILAEMNGNIICRCAIFRELSTTSIAQLAKSMKKETFSENDIIFEESSSGTKLYFIERGTVDIFHMSTNTSLKGLGTGGFFGELGFFLCEPRCASVRCLDFVDVLTLDKRDIGEENVEARRKCAETEARCAGGDVSPLEISCYSCGKLGHVALKCKFTIINSDKDVVKSQWLMRRTNRKVNPNITEPNFKRTERKRYLMKHVNSSTIGPFPEELQTKINRFTTDEKVTTSFRRSSVSDVRTVLHESMQPKWDNIFESYDSEDDNDGDFVDDIMHHNSLWSA